jgi:predicted membrane protein
MRQQVQVSATAGWLSVLSLQATLAGVCVCVCVCVFVCVCFMGKTGRRWHDGLARFFVLSIFGATLAGVCVCVCVCVCRTTGPLNGDSWLALCAVDL